MLRFNSLACFALLALVAGAFGEIRVYQEDLGEGIPGVSGHSWTFVNVEDKENEDQEMMQMVARPMMSKEPIEGDLMTWVDQQFQVLSDMQQLFEEPIFVMNGMPVSLGKETPCPHHKGMYHRAFNPEILISNMEDEFDAALMWEFGEGSGDSYTSMKEMEMTVSAKPAKEQDAAEIAGPTFQDRLLFGCLLASCFIIFFLCIKQALLLHRVMRHSVRQKRAQCVAKAVNSKTPLLAKLGYEGMDKDNNGYTKVEVAAVHMDSNDHYKNFAYAPLNGQE